MQTPTDEEITAYVCSLIPRDQWERVMSENYYAAADIGPDFLGFMDVYYHLACVIPPHWTIIDLGCAYSPQAFLFTSHRAFVGVDIGNLIRFSAPNTCHYSMRISEFLDTHGSEFDPHETFAICSYCPMWGATDTAQLRAFFPNLFVYYPHGSEQSRLKKPSHAFHART